MNKQSLRRFEEISRALAPQVRWCRNTHIAGIYFKNKLLSLAANEEKTHTMISKYKSHYHINAKHLHAEVNAIRKVLHRDDFDRLEMVVTRISNGFINNSVTEKSNMLSCPCSGCSALINVMGFKRIYFTNSEGLWEDTCSEGILQVRKENKNYQIF